MPFPFGKDYSGDRDEIEEFKIRRDMEIEDREREQNNHRLCGICEKQTINKDFCSECLVQMKETAIKVKEKLIIKRRKQNEKHWNRKKN